MENNKSPLVFKIYGLVLEAKEQIFLSIQYASSLEDAFLMAKLEYEKLNPTRTGVNNPFLGSKIWLFSIKSVSDLMHGKVTLPKTPMQFKRLKLKEQPHEPTPKEQEIMKGMIEEIKKRIDPKEEKNKLMQKIIQDRNKFLLEQNKDKFTPYEIKYMEDSFLKKKKSLPLDK